MNPVAQTSRSAVSAFVPTSLQQVTPNAQRESKDTKREPTPQPRRTRNPSREEVWRGGLQSRHSNTPGPPGKPSRQAAEAPGGDCPQRPQPVSPENPPSRRRGFYGIGCRAIGHARLVPLASRLRTPGHPVPDYIPTLIRERSEPVFLPLPAAQPLCGPSLPSSSYSLLRTAHTSL